MTLNLINQTKQQLRQAIPLFSPLPTGGEKSHLGITGTDPLRGTDHNEGYYWVTALCKIPALNTLNDRDLLSNSWCQPGQLEAGFLREGDI